MKAYSLKILFQALNKKSVVCIRKAYLKPPMWETDLKTSARTKKGTGKPHRHPNCLDHSIELTQRHNPKSKKTTGRQRQTSKHSLTTTSVVPLRARINVPPQVKLPRLESRTKGSPSHL